jgi:hypothetical protein
VHSEIVCLSLKCVDGESVSMNKVCALRRVSTDIVC